MGGCAAGRNNEGQNLAGKEVRVQGNSGVKMGRKVREGSKKMAMREVVRWARAGRG